MAQPPVPYPTFDELPIKKDGPKYNAWGLYGPNDQLGKLASPVPVSMSQLTPQNLLTPDVVVRAAQTQIKNGQRVSLNWSMFEPHKPSYGRKKFQVNLIHKHPRSNHDDEWSFNTQISSQWDGFRHYAYQMHAVGRLLYSPVWFVDSQLYYNGTTDEEIHAGPEPLGIHHISKEGIVGRGILIDYAAYCAAHDIHRRSSSRRPSPRGN